MTRIRITSLDDPDVRAAWLLLYAAQVHEPSWPPDPRSAQWLICVGECVGYSAVAVVLSERAFEEIRRQREAMQQHWYHVDRDAVFALEALVVDTAPFGQPPAEA